MGHHLLAWMVLGSGKLIIGASIRTREGLTDWIVRAIMPDFANKLNINGSPNRLHQNIGWQFLSQMKEKSYYPA